MANQSFSTSTATLGPPWVAPTRRLRFRMAAGVALGLAALFAVFTVLMSWAIKLSTEAALRERLVLARHTAAAVDDLLRVVQHQTEALASQVKWAEGGAGPSPVQPSLPMLLHVTGTLDNLGLTDRQRRVVWALQEPDDIQGWQNVASQALEKGAPAFGHGAGQREHPPVALMALPLHSPMGQVAGALVGTIHLAHMGIEIIPLPKGGGELQVEIVDPEGRVLAASGVRDVSYISYSHLALLAHAIDSSDEGTAIHETPGGGGHVVAYAPFQLIPGGVFVEEQNDVALAVPQTLRRVGLFVGSSALLILSLGAWWHASRLTRPLEELTGAAQAMAQGHFDQPVQWKSQDELGLLARSFEEMRLQIKASLEERQRWGLELEQQVEERTQQVHLLLGKVISAQEEERQRVARELHDGAAQNLATLLVVMDGLRKSRPRARLTDGSLLARAEEEARSALQEIRHLMLDLRPAALDDLGLVPALRWYADSRFSPLGILFTFTIQGREHRSAPSLETALFRIVQEAITNVVKHAAAHRVGIRLEFGEETIRITVEDDGKGFDPTMASERGGAGLDGMRERATLAGGSLELHTQPGQGTQVTVTVPALEVSNG